MTKDQERREEKRVEMLNTINAIVTAHLFPFMGIYGRVMRQREEGIFGKNTSDFEFMFRTSALSLVTQESESHVSADSFFIIYDWASLCIPYSDINLEMKNLPLFEAIHKLRREIEILGYQMGISGQDNFVVRMKEKQE